MTKKTILTVLGSALIILVFGFAIATSLTQENRPQTNTQSADEEIIDQESEPTPPEERNTSIPASESSFVVRDGTISAEVSFTATQSGQTAFDLLQENADIKFQQYDFGVFITEINGLAGDTQHFWALYVNDELSQTGADQTVVTPGDVVEFRYDTIQ